jgi:hypothetical protein
MISYRNIVPNITVFFDYATLLLGCGVNVALHKVFLVGITPKGKAFVPNMTAEQLFGFIYDCYEAFSSLKRLLGEYYQNYDCLF